MDLPGDVNLEFVDVSGPLQAAARNGEEVVVMGARDQVLIRWFVEGGVPSLEAAMALAAEAALLPGEDVTGTQLIVCTVNLVKVWMERHLRGNEPQVYEAMMDAIHVNLGVLLAESSKKYAEQWSEGTFRPGGA